MEALSIGVHWRVNPADGTFQEIESQIVVQQSDVMGKLYNVSEFPVIGHITHEQVLVCLSSDVCFLSAKLSDARPAVDDLCNFTKRFSESFRKKRLCSAITHT